MSRRSGPTQPENERRCRNITVRLDPDLVKTLDALAERTRISRAAVIKRALKDLDELEVPKAS